jgi:hypothetical protein
VKSARAAILPLLQDPVHDVRKAALAALHNLDDKKHNTLRPAQSRDADGSRRWITAESNGQGNDDQNGWKSRLRSMMDASS